MGRLYAYEECEVIVLPQLGNPDSFPDGTDMWGRVKTTPYEQSGWCCAEYSIACSNGRIANSNDPLVKAVDASRTWPTSVEEYKDMMDEKAELPVFFTNSGDRR